jgi:putative FmdB family regulatory protein
MPIYEYDCADCRRVVSLLVLRISDPTPPRCPRCGGERLTRLLSRFATVRSEEDRLEALADPSSMGELDEDDPKSVARWMKKMGRELGDEAGEDFDEAIDEAMETEEANEASETSPGASTSADDL